jgi:hypothetical protein
MKFVFPKSRVSSLAVNNLFMRVNIFNNFTELFSSYSWIITLVSSAKRTGFETPFVVAV